MILLVLFLNHLRFHFSDFRHFNLRLKRDNSLFAQDLKVDVSGIEAPYDTSHIYTGEIYGETLLFHKSIDTVQGICQTVGRISFEHATKLFVNPATPITL